MESVGYLVNLEYQGLVDLVGVVLESLEYQGLVDLVVLVLVVVLQVTSLGPLAVLQEQWSAASVVQVLGGLQAPFQVPLLAAFLVLVLVALVAPSSALPLVAPPQPFQGLSSAPSLVP